MHPNVPNVHSLVATRRHRVQCTTIWPLYTTTTTHLRPACRRLHRHSAALGQAGRRRGDQRLYGVDAHDAGRQCFVGQHHCWATRTHLPPPPAAVSDGAEGCVGSELLTVSGAANCWCPPFSFLFFLVLSFFDVRTALPPPRPLGCAAAASDRALAPPLPPPAPPPPPPTNSHEKANEKATPSCTS
jgi:hypothetical protein